jgi:predicted MFS family arabinose efflux permease
VIIGAWAIATLGALIAANAQTWLAASAGYITFMLCIAANPATVSYVLLNTTDHDREGSAESVMATVFASWPAAMVFAPALGGWIADRVGIQADLWLGAAGLLAAICVLALAGDSQSKQTAAGSQNTNPLVLLGNRQYISLAIFFAITLLALYLGFTLAPTFLEDARGYSTGFIGAMFSLSSIGMLLFRSVVIHFRPRISFAILVGAAGLGTLGLWLTDGPVWIGLSFMLLGAISTTWVVMQASIGRAVPEHMRGLALGLTESLYYGGAALAAWLAGQLYGMTPAHDLPLMVGSAAILLVLVLWIAAPIIREPSRAAREAA